MTRPRLLDLFCGAGGASMGYYQAGFDVVGVDINPQPRYPFEFIQADALEVPARWQFDAIHASPPCQAYSNAQRLRKNDHPDLIGPTRERLIAAGVPYVIENVLGAPLREPYTLCGGMFGLRVYRHRLFETSFPIWSPHHPSHVAKQTKMGRVPKEGEFIQVVGNFSGVQYAREAMGIDWMTRDELREAIPPSYTKFIGKQLLALLSKRKARSMNPTQSSWGMTLIVNDLADAMDRLVERASGRTTMADYSGMEPRKNPRQPIFRDHNCGGCDSGAKPCREGNYNSCSNPRARND